MLAYREWYICCSHQSDRLGYVSRTNQSAVFVLWFDRCSNFIEVKGIRIGRFVKWNHLLE